MKITKQEVLENLDQVKTYIQEIENVKEKKKVTITIKNRWTGDVMIESEKTTYKEVVEENKADLREANLYEADLRGADLCEANLREANLRGADLCEANLYEADLRGADLRGADLYKADLYEANFENAELCNAKFYGKTNSPKTLTKKQLPDFLRALGFVLE